MIRRPLVRNFIKLTKKISPHPAVAGLPNKDSGVRHWGLEPQTP